MAFASRLLGRGRARRGAFAWRLGPLGSGVAGPGSGGRVVVLPGRRGFGVLGLLLWGFRVILLLVSRAVLCRARPRLPPSALWALGRFALGR